MEGEGGGPLVSAPVLPEGAAFRFNFPLASDGEVVASGSAAQPTVHTTKVLLNDIDDAPWNACDEDDDVGVIVSTHAIAPAPATGLEEEELSIAAPVGSVVAARATLLGSFLEDLLVCAPVTSVDQLLPSTAPAQTPALPNVAADTLDSTPAGDERAALCAHFRIERIRVALLQRSDASGQGEARWWSLQRPHPNYRRVLGATLGATLGDAIGDSSAAAHRALHVVMPHLDLSVKTLVARARAGGAQDRPWWVVRSEGMATSASLDGGAYGSVATHGGMLRARFLAYQLLHALAFAHARGRAHGALTPRSALLSDDLWLQLEWPWLRSEAKVGVLLFYLPLHLCANSAHNLTRSPSYIFI